MYVCVCMYMCICVLACNVCMCAYICGRILAKEYIHNSMKRVHNHKPEVMFEGVLISMSWQASRYPGSVVK
jgi:hypothetical protein